MLHTGIPWKHLPQNFPPKSTVHDYLKNWNQSRAFRALFAIVIKQLLETGRIDLEECIADATFINAKRGFNTGDSIREIEQEKLMQVIDVKDIKLRPLAETESAKKMATGQQTSDDERQNMKSVNGCENEVDGTDPLGDILIELGIKMDNRDRQTRQIRTVTQEGRPLRQKRNRLVAEHTITWLRYHRRLLTR